MPPRKKARTRVAKPAPPSRPRTSYNPSKHSLATLPYHILLPILTYAATSPDAPYDWPNSSFLLSCATLCRTFHDPAIAALYHNPPTLPIVRAHKLLNTLRERPELGQKIKRLVLQVDPLLMKKVGNQIWDVCEFVLLARGLQHLEFVHVEDYPPYRRVAGRKLGWGYPDALWNALEEHGPAVEGEEDAQVEPAVREGVRLKSWKWNGTLIRTLSFPDIDRIHQQRSFSTLTSLSLIYINVEAGVPKSDDFERDIAKLASSLPKLRDVKFTCSTVVNRKFLSYLSVSASHLKLRELRLINCPFLEASDCKDGENPGMGLTSFLQTPICRDLKVLEIASCRSCTLSFTTALSATPTLEHLSFDARLIFTAQTGYVGLNYDSLLSITDAALITWPPTLQSLTATSLRRWGSTECIAFLSSLVDAAPTMRRLKRLEIWSMLTDIDWRERAEFREHWTEVVEGAFSGTEKVEVKFDNARPAGKLWGEEDFIDDSIFRRAAPRQKVKRGATKQVHRKPAATRGKTATRGGKRAAPGGSSSAARKVVIVQESESDGDEEYTAESENESEDKSEGEGEGEGAGDGEYAD